MKCVIHKCHHQIKSHPLIHSLIKYILKLIQKKKPDKEKFIIFS